MGSYLSRLNMNTFRAARALSVGVVHPCLRKLRAMRERRLPILMYHRVQDGLVARHPYFELRTRPELFARQMQFLKDNNYQVISLEEWGNECSSRDETRPQVCITFDDGYFDFYTHALPILAEHGFGAAVFVITGRTGEVRRHGDGQDFLTWREIRELRNARITIGSHTVTHRELRQLTGNEIHNELRQSKATLEDRLGEAIRTFSYPYAFPENDREFAGFFQRLCLAEGYEVGVTTILGTAKPQSNPYMLPRLPVNSHDDMEMFQAKLAGACDWLHSVQLLYKRIKGASAGRLGRDYLSCVPADAMKSMQ